MADYARGVAAHWVQIPWAASPPRRRLLDEVSYDRAKRGLDLAICMLVLPLVLALLALCALAIKVSSPGPALVSRLRVGKGGHRFHALLLRTARVESGIRGVPTPPLDLPEASEEMVEYAMATPVGRILRETHLDELPQLLNVIRGDMSLVGPRPTCVRPDSIPLWHTARLEVRPGLTGPWRIAPDSATGSEAASRLDIGYVRERNIGLDTMILLRTLQAIVSSGRRLVKRGIDIAISSVLLVVLSPLLVAISIAIVRTSPGPVLFRQRRIGKHGRPFMIMKFRTMRGDAESVLAADEALYAEYLANDYKLPQERDPRITPVGRWLRRTSLDELPQLVNVLCGEMSLVGPRPIVPDEIVHYGQRTPKFCSVLPGLTGAWQVSGRSSLRYPERCEVELNYVRTWSLSRDAEILFRTVGTVLSRRGAT